MNQGSGFRVQGAGFRFATTVILSGAKDLAVKGADVILRAGCHAQARRREPSIPRRPKSAGMSMPSGK